MRDGSGHARAQRRRRRAARRAELHEWADTLLYITVRAGGCILIATVVAVTAFEGAAHGRLDMLSILPLGSISAALVAAIRRGP